MTWEFEAYVFFATYKDVLSRLRLGNEVQNIKFGCQFRHSERFV